MDNEKITALAREVLADQYQSIVCAGWKTSLDAEGAICFHAVLRLAGEDIDAYADASDLPSAAFAAVRKVLGERFPSLRGWTEERCYTTNNAQGHQVHLRFSTNPNGTYVLFTVSVQEEKTDDAFVRAIITAAEFCVNAERAYALTLIGLASARKCGDTDLMGVHTEHLATFVEVADMQEVARRVNAGTYPI